MVGQVKEIGPKEENGPLLITHLSHEIQSLNAIIFTNGNAKLCLTSSLVLIG